MRLRSAFSAYKGTGYEILFRSSKTANAYCEDRERCLNAGMNGYVAKPLTRQALLAAMCEPVDAPA